MSVTGAPSTQHAATPRAVLIGLALAVSVNLFSVSTSYLAGYTHLTFAHIDLGLLIPFYVGILAPNMLIRAARPAWALSHRELLLVFVLGWIGFMVPTYAMSNYLVGMMATAEYYATPENQWRELVFPHLPDWLIITNEQNANQDYYWGLPPNAAIPWAAWIIPAFWWLSLFAGLLAVGICYVILFRKQWAEHERLAYPLAQSAVVMTATPDDADDVLPSIMRNRLFIAGALITFSLVLWNTVSYWTQWTSFPIDAKFVINLDIGRAFPVLGIRMNILSFAFSYFINADILFSVWLFQIINMLEQGVLARVGVTAASGTVIPGGLVAVQFIGGMIAFSLWGVWTARGHLAMVWRHALGRPTNLRDEDEFLSYRSALITGACGLAYVAWWLHSSGMSFPVIALFLTFLFLFYFALCRVMAEAGLVFLDLPINAHTFTIGMIGSASLSHRNLTALGLGHAFARNWKTFPMIIPSQVARLKSELGIRGPTLFFWCAVSFGLSAVSALGFTAWSGYRLGGATGFHADIAGHPGFYDQIVSWMKNSTSISGGEVSFLILGMAIVTVMIVARSFLSWWPISPIGFVVAAGGPVRHAFFPVFLAWLVKIILIRVGGMRLYRDAQPLIIGIIVGYVLGASIAIMADLLYFPGAVHELHFF